MLIEILVGKNLSLGGAHERGGAMLLQRIFQKLTPSTLALFNTEFPTRISLGYWYNIVVMHNGKKEFKSPPPSTYYKKTLLPTTYIYIKYPGENPPIAKLTKDYPNIQFIEFTKEAMINTFYEVLQKQIKIRQVAIQEKTTNLAGPVPSDKPAHMNKLPRP